MTIAIAGGTGFVGEGVVQRLKERGDDVILIGREDFSKGIDHLATRLARVDAIINLSGAPIIARWSEPYKKTLLRSRIETTQMLIAAANANPDVPKVFICANAIGRYASVGCHSEESEEFGEDFLADVCRAWEEEALKSLEHGMRCVIFRFGVVLGKGGGALASMLPIFKLGLGGVIGSGEQYFSWIHKDDLVSMIVKAIDEGSIEGIYNGVSPSPSTNKEFTKTLAKGIHRFAVIPVPAFILRLIFGEGAVVLTSGQCARPERMISEGFTFRYPTLEKAIQGSL